jgi:hypothetical protein
MRESPGFRLSLRHARGQVSGDRFEDFVLYRASALGPDKDAQKLLQSQDLSSAARFQWTTFRVNGLPQDFAIASLKFAISACCHAMPVMNFDSPLGGVDLK